MTPTSTSIFRTEFDDLDLRARGKVRDIYDLGEHLLFVATDRLSAFDYVLPDPIPDKGKVLNQVSLFWFERFEQFRSVGEPGQQGRIQQSKQAADTVPVVICGDLHQGVLQAEPQGFIRLGIGRNLFAVIGQWFGRLLP